MIKPIILADILYTANVPEKEAREIAKVMDKSKARKPTLEYNSHADGNPVYDTWKCPDCGTDYDYDDKYNYCPNCGQHIDWSEIND